jgi:Protein of unknown function (DUF3761)
MIFIRRFLLAVVLLNLLSSAPTFRLFAQKQSATSSDGTKAKQSTPNCTNKGTYVNSLGQAVKRPENCSSAPQSATAQCRDGSYSFSQSRRGTRSHHGCVAKWLSAPN